MKAVLALTTALSSIAAAIPLMPWIQLAPPPAGTLFYTLQAKSSTTAINNQYLTLPSSSSSYTLTSTASAATKFFVQKYNATNTYAFHNADDTRQLALRGSNGTLLYMVDVTSPTEDSIPAGQLMEWATFTFDQNVLAVKDGSTLTSRQWVAVGTGSARQVALWDGITNTTQAVATLTLNVVRATGA